ncbi:MAG: hypothetical protein QNK37_37515 [Acidobacteriota bacterium]|nr:hypothetical protein [Acidobacteriota bacterium]
MAKLELYMIDLFCFVRDEGNNEFWALAPTEPNHKPYLFFGKGNYPGPFDEDGNTYAFPFWNLTGKETTVRAAAGGSGLDMPHKKVRAGSVPTLEANQKPISDHDHLGWLVSFSEISKRNNPGKINPLVFAADPGATPLESRFVLRGAQITGNVKVGRFTRNRTGDTLQKKNFKFGLSSSGMTTPRVLAHYLVATLDCPEEGLILERKDFNGSNPQTMTIGPDDDEMVLVFANFSEVGNPSDFEANYGLLTRWSERKYRPKDKAAATRPGIRRHSEMIERMRDFQASRTRSGQRPGRGDILNDLRECIPVLAEL